MNERVYLDWNATTPLRAEARAAMLEAMDVVGNPSSVHAEGRAARAILETARAQVAAALGADGADIVFTSGATEAAALALAERGLAGSGVEHDAVKAWADASLAVDADGRVTAPAPERATLQLANSETGVVQQLPEGLAVSDLTQGFGKIAFAFNWLGIGMGFVSAHKIGGPKGVGALVMRRGTDLAARIRGGGQEMGRRSGTENIVGIAGFGAAAQAAAHDLAEGVWERVAEIRSILEISLDPDEKDIILVGHKATRLPNTICLAVRNGDGPVWKGETQVMQLDLAGFAISAGSACSSGKARSSGVLEAMGYAPQVAASAIRISLGPETRQDEVERFAESWRARLAKFKARGG